MEQQTIRKSDRFIPWYFVAFFVVLAAMDGTFVYLATSSHTGLVTDQAYERGLAYNETIAAAEKSANLEWQVDIELAGSDLIVRLDDAEGVPVEGAMVRAKVSRPTQEGYDFELMLSQVAGGTYTGPITFPLDGQWDVRVFVEWKQQQFQQANRLIVTR